MACGDRGGPDLDSLLDWAADDGRVRVVWGRFSTTRLCWVRVEWFSGRVVEREAVSLDRAAHLVLLEVLGRDLPRGDVRAPG